MSSSYTVPQWGISVEVSYWKDANIAKPDNGGVLGSSVSYDNKSAQWLIGLADDDSKTSTNWIRSGTADFKNTPDDIWSDYDYPVWVDPNQYFENIVGRTWAPYRLCAHGSTNAAPAATEQYAKGGPAWASDLSYTKMKDLASVDVVITQDKSLWTRCPVLEECDNSNLSIGGAVKLNLRNQASVDKNGHPYFDKSAPASTDPNAANYISSRGMGWFPGYAINLETGERLNMAFGENSWLGSQNGTDMLWNPSTEVTDSASGEPLFGGMHYVYVFGHNGDATFDPADPFLPGKPMDVPRYDAGQAVYGMLNASEMTNNSTFQEIYKREVFSDAMWVNIPLLAKGHSLYETTVTFKIRIAKAYAKGYTNLYADPGGNSTVLSKDSSLTPKNYNFPMYYFNTEGLGAHKEETDVAKDALALIRAVPNPYYAYSGYEQSKVDNIVKITNLPPTCKISIYTLNGTLIRQISKDDNTRTYVDWDLKNQYNVPIAGGMYIIHVNVPGVGEKIVKWFGVIRPVDLDSY
jgi:hypothetical protein